MQACSLSFTQKVLWKDIWLLVTEIWVSMLLETQNIFFAGKCMLEYIIRQYQSFLSKLVYKLKVKVDWKNSRITWGVLGLTSWVCLKASKVYPGIHNRIPTGALAGARSYWKHWWMTAFVMVFCGITCTVPSQ